MEDFKFLSKERSLFLGLIVLGLVCLAITWFGDDALHTRFWSNYLHNTVFFTGIAFISLFIVCAFTTAFAGWYTLFKRIWEGYYLFLIVGLILFVPLILGVMFGWHHLYHWADPAEVAKDEILQHKAAFLNVGWYGLGTVLIVGMWIGFAILLRRFSLREDSHQSGNFLNHGNIRWWAAFFLGICGFSSAAMIWLWVMSVDAHWYSTLFAWYSAASWFLAAIALTILTLIYLKSRGYYKAVNAEHFHDLGKYLFGISIFWTYLWFSQYMLIWYSNIGEETTYYFTRINEYPALFYGNLLINFVAPFFILMRNDTKRKFGSLGLAAALVFFGHWLDYFLMIKPGVLHTAHEALGHGHHAAEAGHDAVSSHGHEVSSIVMGFTLPGLLEIGIFLGFLGLFMWFVFSRLAQAPLVAKRDPYIEESVHHHV